MDYYGRFYRSALYPLLRRVNIYLRRWAGKKYRRLRTFNSSGGGPGYSNEHPAYSPIGDGSLRPNGW